MRYLFQVNQWDSWKCSESASQKVLFAFRKKTILNWNELSSVFPCHWGLQHPVTRRWTSSSENEWKFAGNRQRRTAGRTHTGHLFSSVFVSSRLWPYARHYKIMDSNTDSPHHNALFIRTGLRAVETWEGHVAQASREAFSFTSWPSLKRFPKTTRPLLV